MSVLLTFMLSQIMLFPLLIGLVRYRTIKVDYLPFFWLFVLGALTELASFVLIEKYHIHTNAVPTNIYSLCEWILLAFQFHHWGFLKKKERLFYGLLVVTCMIWVTENIILNQISLFRPYFPIFYSFVIVILGVREINFMITHDNRTLIKNPRFLICIGLVTYFLYRMIFEWSYQLSLQEVSGFTTTVISLYAYINAITNIIFGIALLLIPVNRKFNLE
jgi:hypothetical protein